MHTLAMVETGSGGAAEGRDPPDDRLMILLAELHRLARRQLRRQGAGHTLQPTALVNEAFLRLQGGWSELSRDHAGCLRLAAAAMRSVLVDHARRRQARKRGGGALRLDLEDVDRAFARQGDGLDVLAVHECLESLARIDPELAQIVELRVFGGCTVADTAATLGISARSVEREWTLAKAWLKRELGRG